MHPAVTSKQGSERMSTPTTGPVDNGAAPRTVLRGAVWPGDVAFADGRIVAMGDIAPLPGDTDVDCTGCIVTPGMVNTHHHLFQWLNRGAGVGQELFGWLSGLYPQWRELSREDVFHAATVGLAELLLGGCTTVFDHHYLVPQGNVEVFDGLLDAADLVGSRFYLGRGCMDLGNSRGGLPPDDVVEPIDASLAHIAELHARAASMPLVDVVVAPNSLFTSSLDLMKATRELATELGAGFHLHLAESLEEEEFTLERYGARPVELIDGIGGLGSDTWLGHAIHLSPADIRTIGQAGTGVAHCPSSNARLAMGICPVTDLLESGAPVGLGVDGAASYEVGRLLTETKMALYLARLRSGKASSMLPQDALDLATQGGAACLGRDDLGQLAAGYAADVVVWQADDLADFASPVDGLVLGPDRLARDVWVAGRQVVEGGRLVGADISRSRAWLSKRR
jgi:cytosine/adenosine deaminase-related metal-dependent hydrolase